MNRALFALTGMTALSTLAATAGAVNINLSGDLGLGNWHTPSVPLAQGSSLPVINVFQSVAGVGDFSCDVYTDNSGMSPLGNSTFSMKVTNLVFQAYAPLPTTTTRIKLQVEENFVVPFTNQAAMMAMDGMMSATGGCLVIGNTKLRTPIGSAGGTSLPTLSYNGGNPGPDFFNLAPSFSVLNPPFAGLAHNILYMQIQLEIFIGGNGVVNMPTSFTASSESVPTPGPVELAAIAGLCLSRRRRKKQGVRT